MKVSLRKKDVSVSLAYRLAFFTEMLVGSGFGDASIGITAGKGIDGAGETDRRDDEKDDLRLWLTTLGGFMGRATEVGVPGADGTGDPIPPEVGPLPIPGTASITDSCARWPKSGGAGLLDDMRRGGRSALRWLATLGGLSVSPLRVYCPSFVFRE